MSDTICARASLGHAICGMREGILAGIDARKPGAAIVKMLLEMAIEYAEELGKLTSAVNVEIDWPAGVPEDARQTLRAQISAALTDKALEIIEAQSKACVALSQSAMQIAMVGLREELKQVGWRPPRNR